MIFHIPISGRIILDMGIFIKTRTKLIAAGAALIICILMVVCADTAVMSAQKGIYIWVTDILPALLPFFICVNFIVGTGAVDHLPAELFTFAMSVMSGYPMGSKVIGDMCRNGLIDKKKAQHMMSYCSTSGPVFIIGAVGVGMLGSQTAGTVIALSHYAGALINGILFSFIISREHSRKDIRRASEEKMLMEILTSAIFDGFRSVAVILSYIMLFMFIIDVIDMTGIYSLIPSDYMVSLMQGAIEMTVGCASLAEAGVSIHKQSVLAAVMISWGGISVIGQSMSMLSGTDIKLRFIITTKLFHSILAGIIALFLGKLML